MDSSFLLRFLPAGRSRGPRSFRSTVDPLDAGLGGQGIAFSMKRLSAVLLTKNEEKNIDRCLRTLQWVDEIVVVDTGSTDQTLPIVRSYTQTVLEGDIEKGFAYNRNLGNERARNRWILKVDPDEVVSEELRREIERVLAEDTGVDGYFVATRSYFRGKWIRGCGWYPMYQVRLFDKTRARWDNVVHERLILGGKTAVLKHDILHYSYEDTEHYFRKFNLYTSLEARRLKAEGRRIRWWNMPGAFLLRPAGYFVKSYLFQKGWRDGFYGFAVSLYSSLYVLVKYMKLYEMQAGVAGDAPEQVAGDAAGS
jgi:glycosyltransferase involved in cell wall biosynthesis